MDEPRARTLVAGLVLACFLAGCTGGTAGDTGSPPPPAPTDETTSEAPSRQPVSPEDAAADAAEQSVIDYYRVTDELLSDPQLGLERLVDVASGQELDDVRRQVQQARADGRRQVGSVVVASIEVTDISAGPPTTADLEVCLDVAQVDVVNQNGASVVSAERAPQSLVELTVVDTGDRGWRVETTASQGAACTGS